MSKVAADLDIHRFIYQTGAQLAETRDPEKVLRTFLREVANHFGSECAVVALLEPGMTRADVRFAHPDGAACDLDIVTDLLRGERRTIPAGTVVARLERRGRPWGMIMLETEGRSFPEGAPRALALVANAISDRLERIDRDRLSEVRARIDDKMLRELPPKDLYYQILDGLHQLTRYDHSAQVWIWEPPGELVLVAEQIAYQKGKSTLIGTRVGLDDDLQALVYEGGVYGFDRRADGWREWTAQGAGPLADLLDSSGFGASARPPEGAMLCAALGTREGRLGVLKLAELHPGTFATWERDIVARFALLASLALQRARTVEMLQGRMLKAEAQNALAHLARGVAHDINNALGEVLPLVQQLRVDQAEGRLDPQALAADLERIESGIHLTRGIFGRMMRFAGSGRGPGAGEPGDVRRAVATTADLLRDSLLKSGVKLGVTLPRGVPPARCGTADLERLLLNLMTNARDAMPAGGSLTVAVEIEDTSLIFHVADTGEGMSEETLREIERPFFTTKEHGSGLGLSTCRSIAGAAGGSLQIESAVGRGTRVTVRIPMHGEGA